MSRDATPGQRWAFRAGVALVLVGLSLLGYVGWEFFGTNIVSHRRQQAAVHDLQAQWRSGRPYAQLGVGRSYSILEVPRFGSDYRVPIIDGVGEDVLSSGIGHYPGTAGPGERGNFALAAHRVTHGEPFSDLPDLRRGDKVEVLTRDKIYVYVVDDDGEALTVSFTDTWVLDPHPSNPDGGVGPTSSRRLITLTTCSELFHTDNRLVVFGHLVDVVPRTGDVEH